MKKGISIIVMALFMCTAIIGTSYAKSSKSYSTKSSYKPAPKINLAKSKPAPVIKKAAVKPVVKPVQKTTVVNKTVVNKTTVVNNTNRGSNGMSVGDALVTGMVMNAVMQPTHVYHSAPYHDPYSNKTIDFTCIDGMKYRLTMDGDIKPYKKWFSHKACTDFEIKHYAQGKR